MLLFHHHYQYVELYDILLQFFQMVLVQVLAVVVMVGVRQAKPGLLILYDHSLQ
jgi:hypothetical protein